MNGTEGMTAAYLMNPAEDVVLYGDDLADGMWVLPESSCVRTPRGRGEDAVIRQQRFRRVTRLRRTPPVGTTPELITFIGEWVDGYQEAHRFATSLAWIVKKDSLPETAGGES